MQELVLTDNYISELPTSIGDLTQLTNFNVDRNRLEYLPTQIGNLVNMGVFSLRENQLRSIPSEIGTCKELHVLDVSGNRLQHLPFTLTNLNLKALWLAENQVNVLFSHISGQATNMGKKIPHKSQMILFQIPHSCISSCDEIKIPHSNDKCLYFVSKHL